MKPPRVSLSFLSSGSLPQLIRTLPLRQLLYLWIAIFSTFAMLGFVLDILGRGRQPVPLLALNVITSGLLAVGYGMASARVRRGWFAAMVTTHAVYVLVIPRLFQVLPAAPPGRLVIDAIGTIVTVVTGYSCFLRFINVTGSRYLRAQAEIDIARNIHRVLVPKVNTRIGSMEFLGWSIASGDVGGDLVDVVGDGDGWLGYVADVSGHGVGSGVVMGMFKSALRMRIRTGGSIASLLDDVHAVLMPLKPPQTFVTVACVRGGPTQTVECAVAGHHPILRVRNGRVDEVTTPQMAVGMFEQTTFEACVVDCLPGDLFALLTDGLIEVFDNQQQELGLDWAKGVLQSNSEQPLSVIGDRLLAGARAHGTQLDDQTILLIRRL